MDELARAWITAASALGGDPQRAQAAALDAQERYGAPTRGYHGTAHVLAVLRDIAVLAPAAGLDDRQRACVDAAACAHDVVYDSVPGEDERLSGEWARLALLAAGADASAAAEVERLVLATASHEAAAGDRAAAVLLDADLAILASPTELYERYTAAVRDEYAHLDDDQWRAGRSAVLTTLANRPVLYQTQAGRERWDAAARANMLRELATLDQVRRQRAQRD